MKHGPSLAMSKSRYTEIPIYCGITMFLFFAVLRYVWKIYFFFTIFGMLGSLVISCYGMLNYCCNHRIIPRAAMLFRRIMQGLFWIGLLSFFVIQGLIFSDYHSDVTFQESYALVLGAGLNGEVPSRSMQSRIDAAIEYWRQNPNVVFVACGGIGTMETISEAEAIYRALVQAGIPKKQIILENQSTNTDENIRYAAFLLGEKAKNQSVAIITNEFHLWRAKFIAKRNGFIPTGYVAKTPLRWLQIQFHIREYFSIIKALCGY